MGESAEPNLRAEVEIAWGDGTYTFALKLREIEELQKLCGAGLGEIAMRVFAARFYAGDLYHTIRLGLIGGGMPPVEAKRKVDLYVDGRPLANDDDPSSPLRTARAVLTASYFGIEDTEAGQTTEGEGEAGTATGPDGSTSRPTEQQEPG